MATLRERLGLDLPPPGATPVTDPALAAAIEAQLPVGESRPAAEILGTAENLRARLGLDVTAPAPEPLAPERFQPAAEADAAMRALPGWAERIGRGTNPLAWLVGTDRPRETMSLGPLNLPVPPVPGPIRALAGLTRGEVPEPPDARTSMLMFGAMGPAGAVAPLIPEAAIYGAAEGLRSLGTQIADRIQTSPRSGLDAVEDAVGQMGTADLRRAGMDALTVMGGIGAARGLNRLAFGPAFGSQATRTRMAEAARGTFPPENQPAVKAAYDAFHATTGNRRISTQGVNRALRWVARRHPDHPLSTILAAPLGRRTQQGLVQEAPVWRVHERLVALREFMSQRDVQTGQRLLPGAIAKQVHRRFRGAFTRELLGPAEKDAYRLAAATAKDNARARLTQDLWQRYADPAKGYNFPALQRELARKPKRYTSELGRDLYGRMTTVVNDLAKIAATPTGRPIAESLIEGMVSAGLGAGTAMVAGVPAGYGAGAGAAAYAFSQPFRTSLQRMTRPPLRATFETLGSARPYSDAWMEALGRLTLTTMGHETPQRSQERTSLPAALRPLGMRPQPVAP